MTAKTKRKQVLILEDDGYFRNQLEKICQELADTVAVGDIETALSHLTRQNVNLLLFDWHLIQNNLSSLYSAFENFQPNASKISLFTVPDLGNVISAMKAGSTDVLWTSLDPAVLREKIHESLSREKPKTIAHSFVSRLAETLTEKAITQKTTLFSARREFSRTFLTQILSQQKLRRNQLASLMSVSPRTLHRHLSS